jgi:hypothetical protein
MLPSGQLHIEGLGPEQQQVFINSIKEQQAQQIHAAQMARVLPQQHIINQVRYQCNISFINVTSTARNVRISALCRLKIVLLAV